jgi:3-oxoacyl-[acyl-carrier protein] reductase
VRVNVQAVAGEQRGVADEQLTSFDRRDDPVTGVVGEGFGVAERGAPVGRVGDDALWDRSFDLNVKGTFYGMQEVLPHMLDNGGGTIVNIASMAHKRGGPGTSVHYAAAKGAVVSLTLGVAREFAGRGVRCLSISPASVDTAFQTASGTSAEQAKRALESIPMKRIATADEIGELVLFMCSDACQFMTADTVYVSGGGGFR